VSERNTCGASVTFTGTRKGAATPKLHLVPPIYDTSLDEMYEGWNFNSGNYLFTTDTK